MSNLLFIQEINDMAWIKKKLKERVTIKGEDDSLSLYTHTFEFLAVIQQLMIEYIHLKDINDKEKHHFVLDIEILIGSWRFRVNMPPWEEYKPCVVLFLQTISEMYEREYFVIKYIE